MVPAYRLVPVWTPSAPFDKNVQVSRNGEQEDIQKIALDVRTPGQGDGLAARDRYASLARDPATGLKKMVTDDSVDSRLWRGSDAETADILVSSGFWTDPRLADVMREVLVKSGAHPNVV
ncbi:hypothetical protein J8273_8224 [Carpediemonas membranifera]|uniref:Uncharacterized protein n=1 Tax=Carpediemonas membranifera TaxID=201153 RepID=A0A8J6AY88_9EUKA|nr:hypothetical protein J8273_8224 [Carpediemonas membranifera]|eukprot:KAG9390184.1 hypothetical protein J8273_8224 [Carpediemonas membranifera]